MLRRIEPAELHVAGRTLQMHGRPLLMGIVNVTPDSFSDGGMFLNPDAAAAHAGKLVENGADWLDVGGESTRPGAEPVAEDEELRRVLPVLERLRELVAVPISIDTYKPNVARRALEAGASIINDVTGFRDARMLAVAADTGAACVCMHMQGTPQSMEQFACYDNVISELMRYFEQRLSAMTAAGVGPERIIIDPGIGFAKKRRHDLEILRRLAELHEVGRPILLGASRKRIVAVLSGSTTDQRLAGSIGAAVVGYLAGVHVLRVHEPGPIRNSLRMLEVVDSLADAALA